LRRVFFCFSHVRTSKLRSAATPLFILVPRPLFGFLRSLGSKLFCAAAIFVHTHRDVANDAVVDAHATLEFGYLPAGAFDFQQPEAAFSFMQNLVSQLALAHAFGLGYHAALVYHNLLETVGQARNFIFIRGGVNNEHHFVLSVRFQNLSPSKNRPRTEDGRVLKSGFPCIGPLSSVCSHHSLLLCNVIAFNTPSRRMERIASALLSKTSSTAGLVAPENESSTN